MRRTPASVKAVHAVDCAGEVDGCGEVIEDDGLKAEAGGGGGGVADTEVEGDAGEEEAGEGALAQVAGESGGSDAVVFEEGGVAVDGGAEAFAEDELGVREVKVGVECSAGGSLEAVIGPEGLGAVGCLDGVGVRLQAVGAGEGDVAGRMPVLGEEDVAEVAAEGVDAGDEIKASANFERSAFEEEVVLHVDDEESVVRTELHAVDFSWFHAGCP